jgi:hypothetical protein
MKKQYEAWHDSADNCVSFFLTGSVQQLSESAELLHRIEADTPEEAHADHHIKMGWEPYVPMGKPQSLPEYVRCNVYPEGSGECPNCGRIC